MTIPKWAYSAFGISIAFVVGSIPCGCAGHGLHEQAPAHVEDRDQAEVACEIALLQLDQLIEERSKASGFSTAVLVEANALYELGKELYLEREYALALELIEEAMQMLEEEGH